MCEFVSWRHNGGKSGFGVWGSGLMEVRVIEGLGLSLDSFGVSSLGFSYNAGSRILGICFM